MIDSEDIKIGCLRCRNCKLLPDTNMADKTPVVWCDKKQDRTPLLIANGCGLAKPGLRYQRKPNGVFQSTGGDMTRDVSEVELAWLKARYATTPWEVLLSATGRTQLALIGLMHRRGISADGGRSKELRDAGLTAGKAGRAAKGQIINEAQSKCIMDFYNRGHWPTRGGNNTAKCLERRYAIQNEIIEAVAQLGPRHEWRTILKHPWWTSPGYKRFDKARRARRKAAKAAKRVTA